MNISKKSTIIGAALAIAAAGITAVPTIATAGEAKNVHCFGVNKCKGHNDCKSASNACKGMGSCKGQGFVGMPSNSCKEMGGTTK